MNLFNGLATKEVTGAEPRAAAGFRWVGHGSG